MLHERCEVAADWGLLDLDLLAAAPEVDIGLLYPAEGALYWGLLTLFAVFLLSCRARWSASSSSSCPL